MNLTDNEILKFQRGGPVFISDVCAVYSLTLGEIIDVGYDKFQQYLSLLTATKPTDIKGDSEFSKLLNEISDFQYIILISSVDPKINALFKEAFYFFTRSEVSIVVDPPQFIVGPLTENRVLTEMLFYDLQQILRRMYFIDVDNDDIVIFDDDSPAVKRLKKQMRANREKVRRAKAAKAAQEKSDLKFSDLIGSVTLNNCGLNMENIWNITYYAFHDQLKRMGWRDQFNINQQAALAGAKIDKSQLKHWMRSIASSDK